MFLLFHCVSKNILIHFTMYILYGIILILLFAFIYNKLTQKRKSLKDKHVVITGGSSGIGKAFAVLAAREGAHVTIIARSQTNLDVAEYEIKKSVVSDSQNISSVALDVTDYDNVSKCMDELDTLKPIFMLVNCAGKSICGRVEDMHISDTKEMLDINFYGTYFATKAVVPKMKARKEGCIIMVGSQASLLGIFGFSSYSASKFAIKGFAEALDMELKAYNINITLALPPDTDTPGFDNENLTKPEETRIICESAGLFEPGQVARKIMTDSLVGHFLSSIGVESFLLTTLCNGMSRHSSVFHMLAQCFLLPIFKLISYCYFLHFHSIIKQVAKKRHVEERKND